MTGNALYAACLAAPNDRTAWNALTDFVQENLSRTPVEFTANGKRVVARRFCGDAVLLVTVNGVGGSVPIKKLTACLRRFSGVRS